MQKRVSGVAYITVDGTTLNGQGSFEVPLSNVVRTDKLALNGPVGFDEQVIAPYVKANIIVTNETDLETIMAGTAMTIRVEFANGKTYTLSEAFVRGTPTLSETAECSIEFAGMNGVWS